jgi:hypothetical protein
MISNREPDCLRKVQAGGWPVGWRVSRSPLRMPGTAGRCAEDVATWASTGSTTRQAAFGRTQQAECAAGRRPHPQCRACGEQPARHLPDPCLGDARARPLRQRAPCLGHRTYAPRMRRFKVRGELGEGLGLRAPLQGCERPARSNVESFVERKSVLPTVSLSTVNGLTCSDARNEHCVCSDRSSRNA